MEIYFFNREGRKLGPFTPIQFRSLVTTGDVTPETTVEVDGRRFPASKVKGIEFRHVGPNSHRGSSQISNHSEHEESDLFAENLFLSSSTLRSCAYFIFVSGVLTLIIAISRWLTMDSSEPFAKAAVNSWINTGIIMIITAQVFFFFSHLGNLLAAQYKQNKEYWERSKNNPK
jgi:hypothetical protein